jgi:hypothetical protein
VYAATGREAGKDEDATLGRSIVKRGCSYLGVTVLAVLVLMVFAGYRGREIVLQGAGLIATHHLSLIGEVHRPEQIQVGSATQVSFTLRNEGTTTPRWIRLRFSQGFSEGYDLREVRPAGRAVDRQGVRIIDWRGVEPGDTETFTVELTARTAGEYSYIIEILTNNTRVHEISGQAVVLP